MRRNNDEVVHTEDEDKRHLAAAYEYYRQALYTKDRIKFSTVEDREKGVVNLQYVGIDYPLPAVSEIAYNADFFYNQHGEADGYVKCKMIIDEPGSDKAPEGPQDVYVDVYGDVHKKEPDSSKYRGILGYLRTCDLSNVPAEEVANPKFGALVGAVEAARAKAFVDSLQTDYELSFVPELIAERRAEVEKTLQLKLDAYKAAESFKKPLISEETR